MRARLALVVAFLAACSTAPSPALPRSPGEGVTVLGPEPARSRIERTAREALPVLEKAIGSRWPRPFAPRIVVAATRAECAGEVGFFDVARQEIRVIPQIPSWLVAHELAHGWLGAPYSDDRRQNEGRAHVAALRVLHACPDLGDEEWVRASLYEAAAAAPFAELREPPSPLPGSWTADDERRKNAWYARAWFDHEKSAPFEIVPPAEEPDRATARGSIVASGEIAHVQARSDGETLELSLETRSGFERADTFWNFELASAARKHVVGLGATVDPWLGDTTGLTDPALVEWRPLHRSRLALRGARATLTFPRAMLGRPRSPLEVRAYLVRGEKRVEETPAFSLD